MILWWLIWLEFLFYLNTCSFLVAHLIGRSLILRTESCSTVGDFRQDCTVANRSNRCDKNLKWRVKLPSAREFAMARSERVISWRSISNEMASQHKLRREMPSGLRPASKMSTDKNIACTCDEKSHSVVPALLIRNRWRLRKNIPVSLKREVSMWQSDNPFIFLYLMFCTAV